MSAPKLPRDTSFEDAERRRKQGERDIRDRFLSGQKTRARSGRQSTILAEDEAETTVLGG